MYLLGNSASPSVIRDKQRDTIDTRTSLVTSFTVVTLSGILHSIWFSARKRIPSASSIDAGTTTTNEGRE
jgi:hypothetical protein